MIKNQLFVNLQQRFDEEEKKIFLDLENKEKEIAITALPLFIRKQHLMQEAEFIAAQLSVIKYYLDDPSAWTETSVNAKYQDLVKLIVDESKKAFIDYISERDYVFRDNQLIKITNKEQKKVEADHFCDEFLERAMVIYKNFKFFINADLEHLQKVLEVDLKMHQQEYDNVMKEYVEVVTKKKKEKEVLSILLFEKQKWLNEQKELMLTKYHLTPLEQLCCNYNVKYLTVLQAKLKDYSNPIEYLNTQAPNALHLACQFGTVDMVKFLLEMKISVDKIGTISYDPTYYYPIHHAVMRDDPEGRDTRECLELLKACGSDFSSIDLKLSGRSFQKNPLHIAAAYGNKAAIAWLIKEAMTTLDSHQYQAFIDKVDSNGNTALHYASSYGHKELIDILLSNSANTSIYNKSGNTPLMGLLCSDYISDDNKFNGMVVFVQLGFPLTQENLAILKQRSIFVEQIYPILSKISTEDSQYNKTVLFSCKEKQGFSETVNEYEISTEQQLEKIEIHIKQQLAI